MRSLNQHAWSNTAHILTYKRESNISHNLKRRVYRLLSLYEIADDEFSAVNFALTQQADNVVYNILRKLEPKIYKFAGVDYDRDISLTYISIILNSLNTVQKESLNNEIISFINLNEIKITKIFNSNKPLFYKMPFLTQPEIFIIWYGLEKFMFKMENIFANEFDNDELDDIKALWG